MPHRAALINYPKRKIQSVKQTLKLVTADAGNSDSLLRITGLMPLDLFIDSGNIENNTGLSVSKKLNKDNGKYVGLYVENKGAGPVVATINGRSEETFEKGESGHIYVEVTQGRFGADKEYEFKVVPGTNGGMINIHYEIAQLGVSVYFEGGRDSAALWVRTTANA